MYIPTLDIFIVKYVFNYKYLGEYFNKFNF